MLRKKVKKTVRWYVYLSLTALIVSSGTLFYLIHASLDKRDDIFYILNNMVLGVIILVAIASSIWSLIAFRPKVNYPLKKWLELRIRQLSGAYGKRVKINMIIGPVIFFLMVMAVHGHNSGLSYLETFLFRDEEDFWGMIFGFITGLAVLFFVNRKIYHRGKLVLNQLKELHNEIDK